MEPLIYFRAIESFVQRVDWVTPFILNNTYPPDSDVRRFNNWGQKSE